MSQAEFDRACERYQITREGNGAEARYRWPHSAGAMPVRSAFGDQLPWRSRRMLLAALLDQLERSRKGHLRMEAVKRAHRGAVLERYTGLRLPGMTRPGKWVQAIVVGPFEPGRGVPIRHESGRTGYWAPIDCRVATKPRLTLLDALQARRRTLRDELADVEAQIGHCKRWVTTLGVVGSLRFMAEHENGDCSESKPEQGVSTEQERKPAGGNGNDERSED